MLASSIVATQFELRPLAFSSCQPSWADLARDTRFITEIKQKISMSFLLPSFIEYILILLYLTVGCLPQFRHDVLHDLLADLFASLNTAYQYICRCNVVQIVQASQEVQNYMQQPIQLIFNPFPSFTECHLSCKEIDFRILGSKIIVIKFL